MLVLRLRSSMFPLQRGCKNKLRLTLLGLQSRFGDNWGQIAWNLSALSPKRDWSSKGVKCYLAIPNDP